VPLLVMAAQSMTDADLQGSEHAGSETSAAVPVRIGCRTLWGLLCHVALPYLGALKLR